MNDNSIESGRYWMPRGKGVQVDEYGYTALATKKWRADYNPGLKTTAELSECGEVIVLLGEPGSGKSFELDTLRKAAEAADERVVRYIDLGRHADASYLAGALRLLLHDCLTQGTPTIIFLDALDECRVNMKRAETVIEDVICEVSPNALRVVIACRTPAWPLSLQDTLGNHWKAFGDQAVAVFEIAPYSREQIKVRLQEQGIDEAAFFDGLDHAGAHYLSLQPLGLGFLMSQFTQGATFSTSRWALYENGCLAALTESERRRQDNNLAIPDPRSRLQLAGLIAAFSLLTNKADINWDGTAASVASNLLLGTDQLTSIPLVLGARKWQPSREQFREVLQTGLFVPRGDDLYTFAHRTYAEFLAAHFIASLTLPVAKVMDLLSLPDGSQRLVPQLRELAAWLGQKSQQVLETVLAKEPLLVFDSSVSLSDSSQVGRIYNSLEQLIEQRRYPIHDYKLVRSYGKLAHPELLGQLEKVLSGVSRDNAVREFAADAASACKLVHQLHALTAIALDVTDDCIVRQRAGHAIQEAGSESQKQALVPLFFNDQPEDVDDELKGIALQCAIDLGIATGNLMASVRPRKKWNLTGSYALALRTLENRELAPSDIVGLLAWLDLQLRTEHLEHTWDDFVFHMFSKTALAVMSTDEHWDELGKVAWRALSNHHRLSTSRSNRGFDEGLQLLNAPERRLRLFDSIVRAADGEPHVVAGTLLYGTGFLIESDVTHLIESYSREDRSPLVQKILANMIVWYLPSNPIAREWVLESAGVDVAARDELLVELAARYVEPVVLDSDYASSQREMFALQRKSERPLPETSARQQSLDLMLTALTNAEAGNTWEWLNILSYLRHDGDFHGYYPISGQVTRAALWAKLDETTRNRLIYLATSYLRENKPARHDLAPNQSNSVEDAGVAALVLLHESSLRASPEFQALLLKWTRAVARYAPDEQPRAVLDEMLAIALVLDQNNVLTVLIEVCQRYIEHELPHLPDFTKTVMPDALRARLEALLPTVGGETAFSALADFLLTLGSQSAVRFVLDRIQSLPNLATQFAVKCTALLAQQEPRKFLDAVWPRLQADPASLAALAAQMQVSFSGQSVPLLLVNERITEEIFETLETAYPSGQDVPLAGILNWRHYVQDFRNACLYALREEATPESILALERIAERHPEKRWIGSLMHDAHMKAARDSWIPYDEAETISALGIGGGRIVRSEAELRVAVLDELGHIAKKISAKSSHPDVYFLWDEKPNCPKHEPRLCDWLATQLNDRLSPRGAIVNREVQVRAHNPTGVGERTDILVEVSVSTVSESRQTVRLVIEVKGCWNDDLYSSPTTQLRDNYMRALGSNEGVYVVMWFLCDRWADKDGRKQKTRRLVPGGTLDECYELVASACEQASSKTTLLSPVIIDCTY
ncbi:NACHT domain-containing NTPase [Burkholderia sp. L27(2015)]|uniref:NACHT domain-containing protein n=1 Tax=Burkholderia sp. L27(2015) TaxID=1641858 RepID=UPI00131E70E7|nr:hypothetical protein [Burkholderia sp. L27(2015)]